MKKYITLLLSILLTSCDPGGFRYNYDSLVNEIVSVELINYNNENQKEFMSWVPDHSKDLLAFNFDLMEKKEDLPKEKMTDFLLELSTTHILYKYYVYDSPKGICIKMNYKNGNFEIISCDYERSSYFSYIGTYNKEGEVLFYVGSFSNYEYFESLVNNYFEYQIYGEEL